MIVLAMDDLALVRRWSDAAQASNAGFVVLCPAALPRALPAEADRCVVDLGPRGGADLTALEKMVAAAPAVRFIALSARPEAEEGLRVLRTGARGYCNRLASPAVGSAVLAAVGEGEIWAGRQVTEHLLKQLPKRATSSVEDGRFRALTARESEIAAQVAAGHSNKVIAADNGISERTVKVHLNKIFRKTGLRNRVQLALAFQQGDPVAAKLSSA